MALIIKCKDADSATYHYLNETIDESIVSNIEFVKANNDELTAILKWQNLPNNHDYNCQIWFGDHAKYIVGNW